MVLFLEDWRFSCLGHFFRWKRGQKKRESWYSVKKINFYFLIKQKKSLAKQYYHYFPIFNGNGIARGFV